MNIYELYPVPDNPFFEGLALLKGSGILRTFPTDWSRYAASWEIKVLKKTWQIKEVEGNVSIYNDYPCINLSYPAFSQRGADLLRDLLEPNGELLPVRHKVGIYHFFNCTCLKNIVDLSKSTTNSGLSDIGNLVINDEKLDGLEIFRDRSLPANHLCTQKFVDRVQSAGLQGLLFIPIWPRQHGTTYHSERYRLCKLAEKWRPIPLMPLEIKSNSIVLRLRCQKKKVTAKEITAAQVVMEYLELSLYSSDHTAPDSYFGNIEGSDVVDFEIRIFISTPDNETLLAHMMPIIGTLPWPGQFYVVKRRGNFMDGQATEEYVAVK